MIEKYKKQFSHNMRLRDREEAAEWICSVRRYNLPEDESFLHKVGISIFTAIGKVSMSDPYRNVLFAKLTVIDRQRARNKAKEVCTSPADSV